VAQAYHFARVTYENVAINVPTYVFFQIGSNEIAIISDNPPPLRLGVGDDPVPASGGARSQLPEVTWFIPEPASASLLTLAAIGIVSTFRRRRAS
jgi:hypothetical protein